MKKTITLLLAAASMAMGATPDLNIDNKENNANSSYSFTSTTIEATVAVNLNLSNLLNLQDNTPIFTLVGLHTGGGRNVTVGLGIDPSGPYMDALTANGINWEYLDIELENTVIRQAAHGIVTFTLQQDPETGKVALSELLFLYDKEGNMLTNAAYLGMFRSLYTAQYGNFTTFNITKDLVYGAQVYNSVLDNEAQYKLADEMMDSYLGNSPVPEPTTATLSLLALSALAARRRRR